MSKTTNDNIIRNMPMLPLRGLVIYPFMILHFDVGREKSIKAVEEAMLKDQRIFLAAQKDPSIENPDFDEIYIVGTIVKVKQLLRLPGRAIRVLVEGMERAKIVNFIQSEPYYSADIKCLKIRHCRVRGAMFRLWRDKQLNILKSMRSCPENLIRCDAFNYQYR